ncbi:MAG: 16S rRNA (guanine(527)-N(7))-methyltransferase [Pseudolabrys sp.]|nr:16S rRNA (guanine(527)-N(7))-methyltransferase [Pseudolabrys sp.]
MTPAATLAQDRARALALTPVDSSALARLDAFVALLTDWQRRINLIANSTLSEIWTRHIADSLQLLRLAPDAKIWVDLGSGGGFPAIPIACALAGTPGAMVHLVESNGKKAAFLREAVRVTGASAVVHAERIENFGDSFTGRADAVTARALAPLPLLCEQAAPLIARGAIGLFLKGQDVEAELTEAAKYWSVQAELKPSLTSRDGCVVVVRTLTRKS